ncbi:hypothetical protein RL72_00330 [Microbacterium azadirachtae]|uniref:Uncharacterized protein n=1 Tax=Microbacterium azadirachtae TaxID=582680 RepID=A0A0F0LBP8_9MICO|nr:hypothetical protein RL72_00330 [Microbacterium azadirachtae]
MSGSAPLDPIYTVIFVGAIVVKVRDGQVHKTLTRAPMSAQTYRMNRAKAVSG